MKPTIAVFGDHFLDSYLIGTAERISPEAPVPVVKIDDKFVFPGGASNVVANLWALGATVYDGMMSDGYRPVKNRLYVGTHQLARWDEHDETNEIPTEVVKFIGGKVDGVIISDYGKGAVTYAVIEAIAALNKPTYIDTKRSPRDFDIVMNPTFFPNQKEYDSHLHDYRVQPRVVLKRGANGIQFHQFGKIAYDYTAQARKVISVCGAGDTVLAAFAYSDSLGLPSPLLFANMAAAVVVEKPWTATATLREVQERQIQECGVTSAR
jgi:bifunctional ADP-heptose synthase (sugar kinase/adenylyltransferase)